MLRNWIILLGLLFLVSCKTEQIVVSVINNSDVVHDNTTVEISWVEIDGKLPGIEPVNVIVNNARTGEEVASQVIYGGGTSPQSLIFQVGLAPDESAEFTIRKGSPAQYPVKTYGRFVPERRDDFAWENDRVVFRMYGPALAKENPSNGIDFWLKKTENLIVDKFYYDDLNNNKSYHVDHGEGLDCYKVGHTLGAGGIAPYLNGRLWVGSHYVTQKVLDSGPVRFSFEFTYDNLPVGDNIINQSIVISLDAGSQLNKAKVFYEGDFPEIEVAGGIYLHDEIGNIKTSVDEGYIAYAENAVSDAGIPVGRNYIGVLFPSGITEAVQQDEHILALAPYKQGEKISYYFGGGWSQWGFETDDAWFDYMSLFAAKLKKPLTVTVK